MYVYIRYTILFHFILVSWMESCAHEVALCLSGCPFCNPARQSECGALPQCDEYIKEPGCGCCYTCALKEGDTCGVYTPQCGRGLKCLGKDKKISLEDLIAGRGKCQRIIQQVTRRKRHMERRNLRTLRRKNIKNIRGSLIRNRRHPHTGIMSAIGKKGPCSKHFEEIMTSCEAIPPFTWVPSCDREGFYSPTQCETSYGLTRGGCWCSDKQGVPLENTSYVRRGTISCSQQSPNETKEN